MFDSNKMEQGLTTQ